MPAAGRGWMYLSLTVVLEVMATLALRASDGFTVLWPSLVAVAAYSSTVVVLSWALQTISMSIAYIVWTAAGTTGVAVFSAILFRDVMTPLAWVGIVLVILGVSLINAFPAVGPSGEEADSGAEEAYAK